MAESDGAALNAASDRRPVDEKYCPTCGAYQPLAMNEQWRIRCERSHAASGRPTREEYPNALEHRFAVEVWATTQECGAGGCTNRATHTWSGHPTCDDCMLPLWKADRA